MIDLFATIGLLVLLALPLGLSVSALLDAARRPAWVWALAGRSQAAWIAAILFGTFAVPLGLAISSVYVVRIRRHLVAVESGRIEP